MFIDQLNRKIELKETPKRIISLVPSQTELLYDLGLKDEVVGITKFCIHPNEWFRSKTKVGGTKTLDFEKIKVLQPDLIIGNKEENDQQQIEQLMKHYPVWMSDISNLKDALNMIVCIGLLIRKDELATNLKLEIEYAFQQLQNIKPNKLKVGYFIWNKPYMAAGRNTFISNMLTYCGFDNVFAKENYSRYPELTKEQIAETNPDVIFLSSEPFPFKEKHIQKFKAISPNSKILIVDGELFSWYGSRLLKSPAYFRQLIHSVL